jgi:hypothetical protein
MKRGKSRRSSRVGGKYEVGYARPPLHSRFKRGQSGNPKGRPRGSRSVASVLHRILNEKVPAREGGKVWLMSKIEAIVRRLTQRAMGGDQKAIATVIALAQENPQTENPEDRSIEIRFVSPDGAKYDSIEELQRAGSVAPR